jgi:signal transduction histidine kinase
LEGSTAVVRAVESDGIAYRAGVRTGDVVFRIDGNAVNEKAVEALRDGRFKQADLLSPEDAAMHRATGVVAGPVTIVTLPEAASLWSALIESLVLAALIMLIAALAARAGHRVEAPSLGLATGAAAAVPFLLTVAWAAGGSVGTAMFWLLGGASASPLSWRLVSGSPPRIRNPVRAFAAACLLATISAGVAALTGSGFAIPSRLGWILLAAMTVVPGLVAITSSIPRTRTTGSALAITAPLVASLTPAVTWASVVSATGVGPNLWPIAIWAAVVATLSWVAVRPVLDEASASVADRDAVIAGMEAERARIAADIHDDVLQELGVVMHRLDTAGDATGAAAMRQIADRLRAVCYDLRLPILTDLGAGPALEWLVERMRPTTPGKIVLERLDLDRPPPEVELAVYRVAQEALSNAVRHAAAPVVVRYAASANRADLSITDAGPGIRRAAVSSRGRDGRLGLVNMRQRAEGVGATLLIESLPRGGTRVALLWPAT